MTSGILFALAIGALVVAVIVGLLRRRRAGGGNSKGGGDSANTVAQWTEGETTRLLSSAELPGLYLLRPRFLSKAESVVYLLLKAAFPRHEIFARIRLADVLQVKIGPQGMERLRAFRKIANQHVGFVICDRDMTIVAIVDAKEPDQVVNPLPAGGAGQVHLRVSAAAAALSRAARTDPRPRRRPRLTRPRRAPRIAVPACRGATCRPPPRPAFRRPAGPSDRPAGRPAGRPGVTPLRHSCGQPSPESDNSLGLAVAIGHNSGPSLSAERVFPCARQPLPPPPSCSRSWRRTSRPSSRRRCRRVSTCSTPARPAASA
jgi:hypothetical protein